MEQLLPLLTSMLSPVVDALNHYPLVGSILAIIGALRLINKPLFALLHTIVDVTATDIDNKYLKAIEESKIYKAFLFVLDYVGSVKVKK